MTRHLNNRERAIVTSAARNTTWTIEQVLRNYPGFDPVEVRHIYAAERKVA